MGVAIKTFLTVALLEMLFICSTQGRTYKRELKESTTTGIDENGNRYGITILGSPLGLPPRDPEGPRFHEDEDKDEYRFRDQENDVEDEDEDVNSDPQFTDDVEDEDEDVNSDPQFTGTMTYTYRVGGKRATKAEYMAALNAAKRRTTNRNANAAKRRTTNTNANAAKRRTTNTNAKVTNKCTNKESRTKCYDWAVNKGYCTSKRFSSYVRRYCCKACKDAAKRRTTNTNANAAKRRTTNTNANAAKKTSKNKKIESAKDFPGTCTKSINFYRAKHINTNKLTWDTTLAQKAQAWANELMEKSKKNNEIIRDHDKKGKENDETGENIFMQANKEIGTCEDADKKWYAEKAYYNFQSGQSTGTTGHFTQQVWAATTKYGVGRVNFVLPKYSQYGTVTIIVAKYQVPGNVRGQYTNNVHNVV